MAQNDKLIQINIEMIRQMISEAKDQKEPLLWHLECLEEGLGIDDYRQIAEAVGGTLCIMGSYQLKKKKRKKK